MTSRDGGVCGRLFVSGEFHLKVCDGLVELLDALVVVLVQVAHHFGLVRSLDRSLLTENDL